MTKKRIMVSGCFDMLHSGHVEFFRQAAAFGDLHVAVGSDKTIFELKKRQPVNNQEERLFMVQSVRWVKEAFVSRGSGNLDFIEELNEIKPDFFMVNGGGHTPEKEDLCKLLNIEYLVMKREPYQNLAPRSTTELRSLDGLPYRIDLAGGWLDQPFVSRYYPGSVVTISLEPTIKFNKRSGMATSTRERAREIWSTKIPQGDYETFAKILFCYDNPPGTEIISGSQDSIGLVYPGLAKAHFNGKYWPELIEHSIQEDMLKFVEDSLYLIPLEPRIETYDVLADTLVNEKNAESLAVAADNLWFAIQELDLDGFGKAMRESFEAQIRMFPTMINDEVMALIDRYQESSIGWKLSGAGGGGYLILVSEDPIMGALQITSRRAP